VIRPVRVQGRAPHARSPRHRGLNRLADVDVVIVAARGSLEDLWAFNDEVVARAIAASRYLSSLPSPRGGLHDRRLRRRRARATRLPPALVVRTRRRSGRARAGRGRPPCCARPPCGQARERLTALDRRLGDPAQRFATSRSGSTSSRPRGRALARRLAWDGRELAALGARLERVAAGASPRRARATRRGAGRLRFAAAMRVRHARARSSDRRAARRPLAARCLERAMHRRGATRGPVVSDAPRSARARRGPRLRRSRAARASRHGG